MRFIRTGRRTGEGPTRSVASWRSGSRRHLRNRIFPDHVVLFDERARDPGTCSRWRDDPRGLRGEQHDSLGDANRNPDATLPLRQPPLLRLRPRHRLQPRFPQRFPLPATSSSCRWKSTSRSQRRAATSRATSPPGTPSATGTSRVRVARVVCVCGECHGPSRRIEPRARGRHRHMDHRRNRAHRESSSGVSQILLRDPATGQFAGGDVPPGQHVFLYVRNSAQEVQYDGGP